MAYNGWSNYETWNVALWIDNDQGTSELKDEWLKDCWDGELESSAYKLSERLKGFVEETNPLSGTATMFSDLLSSTLSEVNYQEIAENWYSDFERPDDEETTGTE